jgi:hypothetical protein
VGNQHLRVRITSLGHPRCSRPQPVVSPTREALPVPAAHLCLRTHARKWPHHQQGRPAGGRPPPGSRSAAGFPTSRSAPAVSVAPPPSGPWWRSTISSPPNRGGGPHSPRAPYFSAALRPWWGHDRQRGSSLHRRIALPGSCRTERVAARIATEPSGAVQLRAAQSGLENPAQRICRICGHVTSTVSPCGARRQQRNATCEHRQ